MTTQHRQIRVGNAGRNEIGGVQFIGFDYQTRSAHYAGVEAFQHTFMKADYT